MTASAPVVRDPALFRRAPLPDRFKQGDSGRHRDVQTLNMPRHRDGHQPVAPLPDQPPQPVPSRPHDQRRRQGQIDSIVAHRGVPGEADRPDARLFQLLERPRDVHDLGHLHVRDRAGRRLRRRAVERRRVARLADTPSAPAASTVRRIAPTLCGSSMPSRTTRSGAPARAETDPSTSKRRRVARPPQRCPDATPPRAARSSSCGGHAPDGNRPRVGQLRRHPRRARRALDDAQRLHALARAAPREPD